MIWPFGNKKLMAQDFVFRKRDGYFSIPCFHVSLTFYFCTHTVYQKSEKSLLLRKTLEIEIVLSFMKLDIISPKMKV